MSKLPPTIPTYPTHTPAEIVDPQKKLRLFLSLGLRPPDHPKYNNFFDIRSLKQGRHGFSRGQLLILTNLI
jgi:hypothetical protein